ncbi:MAG: DUF5666 domain-containing protein [bacterium]
MNRRFTERIVFVFIALLVCFCSNGVFAQQRFTLSKNADFSSDDRVFAREDVLYMQVIAPDIDFTDIDKNEFRLKPASGGHDVEGRFDNSLDGTYEASIDLSTVDASVSDWEWRGRIRDESGNEFRARVDIKITGGTDEGEEVQVKGTITTLGADILVVNATTFFVNAQTEIIDDRNQAIAFEDLSEGDLVKVRARKDAEGNFVAIRIKLEDLSSDEVEVKGKIQGLTDNSLEVLGKTFLVDANTEILDHDGNAISFEDLVEGQTVQVKARLLGDGSLLAIRIKIEDEDGEVEFKGTIDALTETSIVVNSTTFLVTDATEIVDHDGETITLSDLAVGQVVEIRGVVTADGLLRATSIKVEDRIRRDDELEVTGTVTEIGADFIVAAGFLFQVDDHTLIQDDKKNPIALSDIKVGFVVEIRADVSADGSLLATRIKIEDFFKDELEITGAIESLGDNSLVVATFEFVVTDTTLILDDDNNAIAFGDLRVGQVVEIHAELQVDGTLVATKIKVEDVFKDEVELTATIESIGPDSLVLAGITFFVDATTQVLDNNTPIPFSTLQVGELVEVKGILQADGRLLATRIKVEDRIEDEVEITGVIDNLTSSSITVQGQTFGITENTVFFDNDNVQITLNDLAAGLIVEIRGDLQPDGTLVAIRVKIEDRSSNEVEVRGAIEALAADTIRLLGISFVVDNATEVLDDRKNPIAFSELRVDQTAEVRGLRQPDGTLLATRIKLEEVLLIAGVLQDVVVNGVRVAGQEVLFDANTMILGRLNVFLSIEDLSTGQLVEVRAQKLNSSGFFATKVKVRGSGLVTSVPTASGAATVIPEAFTLKQNYPNPFNPGTTIRFEIRSPNGALAGTKLTVFNLLGQTVRVLVDQPLASGNHTVQWDGRNANGNLVPSGVYLYRLEVGSASQTRRMVLLK